MKRLPLMVVAVASLAGALLPAAQGEVTVVTDAHPGQSPPQVTMAAVVHSGSKKIRSRGPAFSKARSQGATPSPTSILWRMRVVAGTKSPRPSPGSVDRFNGEGRSLRPSVGITRSADSAGERDVAARQRGLGDANRGTQTARTPPSDANHMPPSAHVTTRWHIRSVRYVILRANRRSPKD